MACGSPEFAGGWRLLGALQTYDRVDVELPGDDGLYRSDPARTGTGDGR